MASVDFQTPVHSDMRSAAEPYRRDKDHSQKWAFGQRERLTMTDEGSYVQNPAFPPRPMPRPSNDHHPAPKTSRNVTAKNAFKSMSYITRARADQSIASPAGHLARRKFAAQEVADHEGCSAFSILSDSDLHLSDHAIDRSGTLPAVDADITYSFDAPRGPAKTSSLEGLIEKAEAQFVNRETDRIVRTEYELLDGEGEVVAAAAAKKKSKRASPKQQPVIAAEPTLDDDDYELV